MKKRKVICVKLLGSFCYTMPDESEEPPFGKDPAGQERKEYCMISGKIGKKAMSFLQYLVINHTRNITAEELEERRGQGYNRNSVVGKAGAERLYEDILRPRDGNVIQIINELGDVKDTVLEKPAEDGRDVVLTIDIILQQHLYQELEGD